MTGRATGTCWDCGAPGEWADGFGFVCDDCRSRLYLAAGGFVTYPDDERAARVTGRMDAEREQAQVFSDNERTDEEALRGHPPLSDLWADGWDWVR